MKVNNVIDKTKVSFNWQEELQRKFFHLPVILLPLGYYLLHFSWEILQWSILIFLLLIYLSQLLRVINSNLFPFEYLMRPNEKGEMGIAGFVPTTTMFCLLVWLAPIPLSIPTVIIAVCVPILGDGAAAVVGKAVGKHFFGKRHKTFEGLIAGFLTAYFLTVSILLIETVFSSSTYDWLLIILLPIGIGTIVVSTDFLDDLPVLLSDNIINGLLTAFYITILVLFFSPALLF